MEFLRKYNITPLKVVKTIAVVVVGLIIFSLVFALVRPFAGNFGMNMSGITSITSPGGFGSGIGYDQGVSESYAPENDYLGDEASPSLSKRNILPSPTGGTTGDDAEEYEVTDYSATIETTNLTDTCKTISNLKEREYVIFENSNQYDLGCDYVFKVKHTNVSEILSIIKTLDPKDLSENIRTIKQVIDDYTNETEVLKKKKKSIEETLESSIQAYDGITRLATETRDAEALAKIIDSKIKTIERLTSENILVTEQLDRLQRAKAQELDRIDYTYFRISVYETNYIDGEQIIDSWKYAIKNFVQTLNSIIQGITLGLLGILLFAIQYLLYFFLLLFIIRFAWKFAKEIWQRQ